MKKQVLILLAIVFIGGCIGNTPTPYEPAIGFTVSERQINLPDNQVSNLIYINVEKRDNSGIQTSFDVIFKSSDPEHLTVLNDDDVQIEKMTTKELTSNGAKDILQFKVRGKKLASQPESPWTLNISLLYNGTKIDEKTLLITVK